MGKILDKLAGGRVLVSDGALGTFLHQKGLKADECPESWNIERPDDVRDIAAAYVAAGSDFVLTNSFGGSPLKLGGYGLSEQCEVLNKKAAELAREAAGDRALVLGSIGPTGKMIFMGEVAPAEVEEGFAMQAAALAAGGADGILIETMSDITEAALAVKAARKACDLDVGCTFTFEKNQDGLFRTMMGNGVPEALAAAIEAGAVVVGANCGNGTEGMISVVKEIRAFNPEIPVLIHANAGLPEYCDGKTVFPEGPEEMASLTGELLRAGVNIVGGCCGTTPAHIREICKVVRN